MNEPVQHGNSVHVNGIDIHYTDTGAGEPLLLLDNAMVSTNPVWAALPFAYVGYTNTFAAHFRVIVPDTRGSGMTVHPGGPITHTLLADDVAALIDALHLDRPLVCGFSDGGEVATIVGIRHPGSLRAVVNHAGYDAFNPDPDAPSYAITRQMLGGKSMPPTPTRKPSATPATCVGCSISCGPTTTMPKDRVIGRRCSAPHSSGSVGLTATVPRTWPALLSLPSYWSATATPSARSKKEPPSTTPFRPENSASCPTPAISSPPPPSKLLSTS